MVPALLLREIVVAVTGGAGVWLVGTCTPLEARPRQVLQAAVLAVTVGLMGRIGGIW